MIFRKGTNLGLDLDLGVGLDLDLGVRVGEVSVLELSWSVEEEEEEKGLKEEEGVVSLFLWFRSVGDDGDECLVVMMKMKGSR